jgi:hypothetical protein
MTPQEFEQLPVSIQREFVRNACDQLSTIRIDKDIMVDLFYSCTGDFFVEIYSMRGNPQLLNTKSFYFNDHQIRKFIAHIDISGLSDI